MKIYVQIENKPFSWNCYIAEDLRGAKALIQTAKDAGKRSGLLWLPESAAELSRQTKNGTFWAKKVWHFNAIPDSKAKGKAIRKLGKKMK